MPSSLVWGFGLTLVALLILVVFGLHGIYRTNRMNPRT